MRSQCMQPNGCFRLKDNPNPHTSDSTGRWGCWREILGRLGVSWLRASTARNFPGHQLPLWRQSYCRDTPKPEQLLSSGFGENGMSRSQDWSRPSPTDSWLEPVLPHGEKLTLREITRQETTRFTAVQESSSPRRVSTGVPVGLARGRCASTRIHLVMSRRQLNNTS